MKALLLLAWWRHRAALAVLCAALFGFQLVITRILPGPEQAELMRGIIAFLPQALVSALGDEMLSTLTPSGFLAFGYIHPFMLALVSVWVVRVSAGPLAGEIGMGTMDLLASRPIGRGRFVGAGLITVLAGLFFIAVSAFGGSALGLASRPVPDVQVSRLVPVVAAFWLLFAAFGAAGLAISATRRTGGNAIAWTSALVAGSFALEYLARAWEPIRWMKPLSLFAWYHPQRALMHGLSPVDLGTLVGVSLVAAIAAFVIFGRRDL